MSDLRDFPDASFSGVHHGPLQAGEWITLTDPKGRRHSVFLERGKIFHTTKGGIAHDDLIDGPDAVVIRSKGNVEYLALRPLMADYSVSMPRGAAVIYPKDTAQIVTMADIFPGAKVVEAGAGSGALTTALLRAVGIHGEVVSFERREDFAEVARKNVTGFFGGEHPAWRLEVGDLVESLAETDVDRVVLDMLAPWECVDAAASALVPGGVFCAYVATTTQLSRVVETLRAHGEFTEPRAWESLVRDWHVEGLAVRPGHRMQGHTAFLVTARRMAPGVKAPRKKRRPAPGAYGDDYSGPRRADTPAETTEARDSSATDT
ncbi:tRNA (adenine-N1)-methyltransferase [Kribbella alba]|uniref:tRNA (adenine(58)-N(1))-methyltransferase TrmI n=1 Tax=Kribbella alba TaxID=190197 RepID=A0ABN2FH68_9ACTN